MAKRKSWLAVYRVRFSDGSHVLVASGSLIQAETRAAVLYPDQTVVPDTNPRLTSYLGLLDTRIKRGAVV